MGCAASSRVSFPDKYKTIEDVRKALRAASLENADLIVAIDVTRSNEASFAGGHTSFEGRDLHDLTVKNPYERVMELVGGEIAAVLDRDAVFPVLAFGDAASVDHESGCVHIGDAHGFENVRGIYRSFVSDPRVIKSGPTSFAGVVRYTIDHVIATGGRRFHTLLIITDGQINDEISVPAKNGKWTKRYPTVEALVDASHYPIEVIIVGVGDGPWDQMEALDDQLVSRKGSNGCSYRVDCVQFVPFSRYMRVTDRAVVDRFVVDCLQEVPQLKSWLDNNVPLGPDAKSTPSGLEPMTWTSPAAAASAPPPTSL